MGIKGYNIPKERMVVMKPLKEKVSITLDSDVLERIKVLAEEDDRNLSQYINLVLKRYVKSLDEDKK